MLDWFGRRKPGNKPAYRKARDVIANLGGLDSAGDLAAVTAALEALTNHGDLLPEERFEEIQLLDSAGQPRLFEMIKAYLSTPRQKKARESELWGGAYGYLQELYLAYLLCVRRYEADAGGSTRFRRSLPIAVARALRALRLQLKWALLRYTEPDQSIWTEMAELYRLAVSNGVAEEAVPFYPGRQITVKEEFVKGLMIAASSSDSLRPTELDLATRLVDHYSRFFVIADQPFDGCTHWFDLNAPCLPVRSSRAPPENAAAQYFGAGVALTELNAAHAEMAYTGTIPQEFRFYEKQDDQLLLAALNHLVLDWAGKTQARQDERKRITSRLTIVPGLPDIIRALTFAVNDSLDFTDQPAAESWVVEDVSAGGYGAVIPAVAGDWVEVGSLVGIEGSSFGDWRIGVVRRVNRLEGEQQRVGVQLLGSGAALVMLRQKASRASAKSAEPAVLITLKPEMQDEVEVLVRGGIFSTMDDTEMMLGKKPLRLRPIRVVERSARAERVAFQVLKA
jgi:hypothetical protein